MLEFASAGMVVVKCFYGDQLMVPTGFEPRSNDGHKPKNIPPKAKRELSRDRLVTSEFYTMFTNAGLTLKFVETHPPGWDVDDGMEFVTRFTFFPSEHLWHAMTAKWKAFRDLTVGYSWDVIVRQDLFGKHAIRLTLRHSQKMPTFLTQKISLSA